MGQLRMMKQGVGDALVAEWDIAKPETVGVSKSEFERMMQKGKHFAYASDGKGANKAIDTFDETADTITLVPRGFGG